MCNLCDCDWGPYSYSGGWDTSPRPVVLCNMSKVYDAMSMQTQFMLYLYYHGRGHALVCTVPDEDLEENAFASILSGLTKQAWKIIYDPVERQVFFSELQKFMDESEGVWKNPVTGPQDISARTKNLPGMGYLVKNPPCLHFTHKDVTLWRLVQHLNDQHRWSREKIADFLDELHDSGQVNLEFSPWKEE